MASGNGLLDEFEWIAAPEDACKTSLSEEKFVVLKEGYLNVCSEEGTEAAEKSGSSLKRASFTRGWKKRWCVLSQTHNGTNILCYKQQSSVSNFETPVGVVLMEECSKMYTVPSRSKTSNIFAIDLLHRTVKLQTDKESDMLSWLDSIKNALDLKKRPASLKGLPHQKAVRKSRFSVGSQ